jgi:sialate O-acetylesterase
MKLRTLGLLVLLALAARADVACPTIFTDHMVLQREQPVPVWGTASPGEAVTVEFAGQSVRATADVNGRWQVRLASLPASSESRTLTVRGNNVITFQDVLVGEVWFCSGQSNMEKPLGARSGQIPTDGFEAELKRADCPTLRLFQVPRYSKPKAGDGSLAWTACTGEALTKTTFSAAAYYFGRELVRELGVPIGLIHSSYGGTRIETWMPPEAFANDPELRDLAGQPYSAMAKGVQSTDLYKTMVAPYVPFALRGFLWYQGESNVLNADHLIYVNKMRALITSWRQAWGEPDAPFYFAQLAPYTYSKRTGMEKPLTTLALPALWEAQLRSLEIPHTGMVATTDLTSDVRDIHPTNKRDVGLRLAKLALAETYGRKLLAQSPRFLAVKPAASADKLQVSFAYGDGLKGRDGQPLTGFEVAGEDRTFQPATAEVSGDHVLVTSPQVSRPVAVRYAWTETSMPNLVNSAGLPALPFRSDNWPLVLEAPKAPSPPASK